MTINSFKFPQVAKKLTVSKVTVLIEQGSTDTLFVDVDLPHPFNEHGDPTSLKMEIPKGAGVQYEHTQWGDELFSEDLW